MRAGNVYEMITSKLFLVLLCAVALGCLGASDDSIVGGSDCTHFDDVCEGIWV